MFTLSTTELNIIAIFKCSECGQHNAYAAGHVALLDQDIMSRGTATQKFQHVLEIVQEVASELAGNVLGNIETVITLNPKADAQDAGVRYEVDVEHMEELDEENSMPWLLPSIESEDLPEIGAEEVNDFVNIDLNLIDSQWYFNEVFGGRLG
jgi:hypothetical protein